MSFQAPLVLLALLALPVLAVMYVAEARRRRRVAVAFALPRLQPSVAPRRPRWRRHLPALALATTLAILVAAAARPQRTVAVPIDDAAIMLATDVSGSMQATDVGPSRLKAAERAASAAFSAADAEFSAARASDRSPTVLSNSCVLTDSRGSLLMRW